MTDQTGKVSLIAGFLAAIGASVCCVVPFALLSLGISGAWISDLTSLKYYRPIFVGLTLVFLWMAFHELYLGPQAGISRTSCADPRTVKRLRIAFWIVSILLLGLLAVPSVTPM